MQYQLQVVKNPNKGRNKRVGSLQQLPSGRLGVFVGYCQDGCNSKVCMDYESARSFTRKFGAERKKPFNRVLLSLVKRLEERSR